MIQIDKNVAMPPKAGRKKYPFAEMEIGDSFFSPDLSIRNCGPYFTPHKPKKFAARTSTESGVKGVRVWRIA